MMAKKYVNISGRNFNYERQPDGTYNFKDDAARADLNSVKADFAYLDSNIPGTKQIPTFVNGQITKMQHKDANNNVVREDVFTFEANKITEVRTLATGQTKTFITNLTTLETEVI